MGFICNDRNQIELIGYSISDFVPKDNKSRFVVEIISRLDLSGLYSRYSNQGNDAYDPAAMLATWFLAYSEGVSSTRKLEKLCHYDLRFIYVSANLQPDHSSLSRFRKNHIGLMADYFVQLFKIAQQAGVSDFKAISIDGTKIKGACSSKQSYREDQLNRKLEALRKDIAEYMLRCDHDDLEMDDLEEIRHTIEALQKKEEILLECRAQLQERKQKMKKEHRDNHQINLVDPDARFMPKSQGPNYNSQIAVDSMTNLIVANSVVTDPNDQNQFTTIHQNSEQNLGGDSTRQYTLDSGYHSLDQLEYAAENEIDAVIADPTPNHRSGKGEPTNPETIITENRRVERSDFIYDKHKDCYKCPSGWELGYLGTYTKKGKLYRIYQSANCQDCPIKSYCLSSSQKPRHRRICRDNREGLAEMMYERLQTEESKHRMKIRAMTAEPVFGNIKENLGFRRFCVRGLKMVQGEFNLMSIAHNLNSLYKLYPQIQAYFSDFYSIIRQYCRCLLANLHRLTFDRWMDKISLVLL